MKKRPQRVESNAILCVDSTTVTLKNGHKALRVLCNDHISKLMVDIKTY